MRQEKQGLPYCAESEKSRVQQTKLLVQAQSHNSNTYHHQMTAPCRLLSCNAFTKQLQLIGRDTVVHAKGRNARHSSGIISMLFTFAPRLLDLSLGLLKLASLINGSG